MSKIFVSIASYRDPELSKTIQDLLSNAANPDNLVICIAWQRSPDDVWDTLDEYEGDSRFKIIDIPYLESKGVCWARHLIQREYDNEDYYLQLDSHHRFIPNWDEELIDIINYLKCKGHYKPVISSYLPSYFPDKDPDERTNEVWTLNIDRFMPEGAIFIRPQGLQEGMTLTEPFPTRFLSGHFIFTIGNFVTEVPYDPNYYFHGEESSLSARAYTHGFNLFNPHKVYAWHEYTREGKAKQWDDDSIWAQRDKDSYARIRELFGMNSGDSSCEETKLHPYGFGTVRSLEDYEKYAGLKFATRQVHKYTLTHRPPPTVGDYESGLCNKIKVCIDVYKGSLIETDYDHFAVALLDEKGDDLYRQDLTKEEIETLMTEDPNSKFINIWREYEDLVQPHSWRVWPHTISKGWMEKIDQKIVYG
jgi:hypothetical protein